MVNDKGGSVENKTITPLENKFPIKDIDEQSCEELRNLGLELISQEKGIAIISKQSWEY